MDCEKLVAEFSIYENCHIYGTEEAEVGSLAEAEERANAMEAEYAERNPDSDWWVEVEGVYECD